MTKNKNSMQYGDSSSVILILLIACLFWGIVAYFTIKPKAVTITTVPSGAKVIVNNHLMCPSTPCSFGLNRITKKHFAIEKPHHHHYLFTVPAFGRGWSALLDQEIVMKHMVSEDDKSKDLKKCRAERAEVDDPLNQDAMPCHRIPAMVPRLAKMSGHCRIMFDVNENGNTTNIRPKGCTDSLFKAPSVNAVELWVYLPKIKNGKNVLRKNVESKMTFRLTDQFGNLIPEPPHFEKYDNHTHENSVHDSFEENK